MSELEVWLLLSLAVLIRSVSSFGYALLVAALVTFVFEAKSVVVNVILGKFAVPCLDNCAANHVVGYRGDIAQH